MNRFGLGALFGTVPEEDWQSYEGEIRLGNYDDTSDEEDDPVENERKRIIVSVKCLHLAQNTIAISQAEKEFHQRQLKTNKKAFAKHLAEASAASVSNAASMADYVEDDSVRDTEHADEEALNAEEDSFEPEEDFDPVMEMFSDELLSTCRPRSHAGPLVWNLAALDTSRVHEFKRPEQFDLPKLTRSTIFLYNTQDMPQNLIEILKEFQEERRHRGKIARRHGHFVKGYRGLYAREVTDNGYRC